MYITHQVFITDIEALTGLNFGKFHKHNPQGNVVNESIVAHVAEKAKDIIL